MSAEQALQWVVSQKAWANHNPLLRAYRRWKVTVHKGDTLCMAEGATLTQAVTRLKEKMS